MRNGAKANQEVCESSYLWYCKGGVRGMCRQHVCLQMHALLVLLRIESLGLPES